MTKKVYWIQQSVDDEGERPDVVTYGDAKYKTGEGYNAFVKNCRVAAGDAGFPPEKWFIPELRATQPGKTPIEAWDYYACATFGVFSPKALQVLTPYVGDRFQPLEARLEGHLYYCLHCRSRTDCLDAGASQIDYLAGDQDKIMWIDRHVFNKDVLTDPMIFAIPKAPFRLYCTDSLPEICKKVGLRGFDFELVDSAR